MSMTSSIHKTGNIPYSAPALRYPCIAIDNHDARPDSLCAHHISNLTVVWSSSVTVWVRKAALRESATGYDNRYIHEQRTSNGTLPIVIELILHETQHKTVGVMHLAHELNTDGSGNVYLDFPTADSPENGQISAECVYACAV